MAYFCKKKKNYKFKKMIHGPFHVFLLFVRADEFKIIDRDYICIYTQSTLQGTSAWLKSLNIVRAWFQRANM